jgi:hypothetical protein
MLKWTRGPHSYDGIWGKHWYRSVNQSTGFVNYEDHSLKLSKEEQKMVDIAEPFYKKLEAFQLIF